MDNIILILIAAFGAFVQELLYWYELRTKLSNVKYKKLLASPSYWIVTIMMIVASGVGIWILYSEQLQTKSVFFILGAAFPLLFKKVVAAAGGDRGHRDLGETSSLKDYFQL